MAVHFPYLADGNGAVVVEGAWNYGGPETGQWVPLLSGATALGIVFTLQADAPLPTVGTWYPGPGVTRVPICQLWSQSTGDHVFYIHYDTTSRRLVWALNDENYLMRVAVSEPDLLIAGLPQRFVWRWRAVPERFSLQINGIERPLALSGTPIAHLYNQPLNFLSSAGLELGAEAASDAGPLPGIYQQWAVTIQDMSDVDAASYGERGNPGAMPGTAWRHWVTLSDKALTTVHAENFWGVPAPYMALLGHDAYNTGFDYDAQTHTYAYGGANFVMPGNGVFATNNANAFRVVPDLTPPIVPDAPSLPVEWFELEELNGNCGYRRPGGIIRVPQDMDFRTAQSTAEYGDDIVIDHTYTGALASDHYLPEKTVTAATPRMPPHQKRRITMSRAITSAR
jgi:hypothetical protein